MRKKTLVSYSLVAIAGLLLLGWRLFAQRKVRDVPKPTLLSIAAIADELKANAHYDRAAAKYLEGIRYADTLYPDLRVRGEAAMRNQAAWCYVHAGRPKDARTEVTLSLQLSPTRFATAELADLDNPQGQWRANLTPGGAIAGVARKAP